jgi:hypothetical protein
MAETNRRHFPRQPEKATIQVLITLDDSRDRTDSYDSIPVKICNQSEDGLYIEAGRALEPGSNVSIMMVPPQGDRPEDPYYMHDGRVVWCKKVDDEPSRFGVGLKILRKVVRADVLTSRLSRPA